MIQPSEISLTKHYRVSDFPGTGSELHRTAESIVADLLQDEQFWAECEQTSGVHAETLRKSLQIKVEVPHQEFLGAGDLELIFIINVAYHVVAHMLETIWDDVIWPRLRRRIRGTLSAKSE